MTDAVDWTDPVAKASALRTAYFALVSGDKEAEIRTRTLDAEEVVRFQTTDLKTLRSELQDAEAAVLAAAGATNVMPTRFAITGRHKRHPGRDGMTPRLYRGD